eukprot:CAMPEP_0119331468 /NCGR_PEP_ID=MMETSP1333-20130426/80679_1 /TAXON_ID=418940 /ORGANISM="Scyphosphaera apsteinii, Strain RCC1455" /LENGTH=331 /DNA_ID=CAMNT_0007341081 /DNA_START=128 /DNA_END=1123 /DNA_ORIENTATION=-
MTTAFVLILLTCAALARSLRLSGAAHTTAAGSSWSRHAPLSLQFGDFKWPEIKIPILSDDAKTPAEATSAEEDARAKERTATELAKGDAPDFGEKLFSFFFGAPQEGEVAGLARTGGTPDTYPATTTEFADPVEGDSVEVQQLRPMLKNTNLEFLRLRLAYDSDRDGWSAAAWHSKVDKCGPCMVVAKTIGGAYCGGYAPKGFAGYGETRGSIAAFLFTWPDGDTSRPVIKLRKIGGAGLATIDEPETGPRFGSDGFVVRMNPGTERIANSKLGPYYELMPDSARNIFAPGEGQTQFGTTSSELTSLRTYVGVWPEGERIPFDGAIPFAIE